MFGTFVYLETFMRSLILLAILALAQHFLHRLIFCSSHGDSFQRGCDFDLKL